METVKTCDLKNLIIESLGHINLELPFPIFNRRDHLLPRLESDRTNLIIVYPGCFNPPHHGHAELLEHVFSNHGVDWNIIAAIILPMDDSYLEHKNRYEGSFRLPKTLRSEMWNDHFYSDSWTWVFNKEQNEFNQLQDQLTKTAKDRGFKVEYVLLCGPDDLSVDFCEQFRSRKIISSNTGCPAEFWNDELQGLSRLEGFGDWSRIQVKYSEVQREAQAKAGKHISLFESLPYRLRGVLSGSTDIPKARGMLYEEFLHVVCDEALNNDIYRAYHLKANWEEIRFIKDNPSGEPIYSEDIRHLCKVEPRNELEDLLRERVLGWHKLWQYLETNGLLNREQRA